MGVEKYKKVLDILKKLPDDDKEKLIRVAGVVSAYVKEEYGIDLIVVGGLSVEIYTEGGYTTQDIDFVGAGHEKIMKALVKLGFTRYGKDSFHEELRVYVEVPSATLKDADESYIRETTTVDGFTLRIIGIEDIIKDRLRSFIHWEQLRDREWAYNLIKRHLDYIDCRYIENTLTEEEREVFKVLLDAAKEVNKEESLHMELVMYLDREKIPFSLFNETIFMLPVKDTYIGFSLVPIVMGYLVEETDGEEMLILVKDEMTVEELTEWLQTINYPQIDVLIEGIRQVYGM